MLCFLVNMVLPLPWLRVFLMVSNVQLTTDFFHPLFQGFQLQMPAGSRCVGWSWYSLSFLSRAKLGFCCVFPLLFFNLSYWVLDAKGQVVDLRGLESIWDPHHFNVQKNLKRKANTLLLVNGLERWTGIARTSASLQGKFVASRFYLLFMPQDNRICS